VFHIRLEIFLSLLLREIFDQIVSKLIGSLCDRSTDSDDFLIWEFSQEHLLKRIYIMVRYEVDLGQDDDFLLFRKLRIK